MSFEWLLGRLFGELRSAGRGVDCLQLQSRWQNGCTRQRDKSLTLGWSSAGGMEGRDGEEMREWVEGTIRTVRRYALCNGTSPFGPQIFTEFPETHKMFNGSVFICVCNCVHR